MGWQVYLVRCSDDSLYCGISNNIKRRMRQHNGEIAGGAKYTKARQPVTLVYVEDCEDRVTAAQREYQLKQLSTKAKQDLCRSSSKHQS